MKPTYIDHVDFHKPDATARFLGPLPKLPPAIQLELLAPDDARRKPNTKALSRDEMNQRFLALNFAKRQGDERRAAHLREYLTRANLPLVTYAYHSSRTRMHGSVEVEECFSQGAMGLARAIERFDVSRGWRFSTFAMRVILNALNTVSSRAAKRYGRLQTVEITDATEGHAVRSGDVREDDVSEEIANLRHVLATNAAHLTVPQRILIERRYLTTAGAKQTFQLIADALGVSKERARQIEIAAKNKLRKYYGVPLIPPYRKPRPPLVTSPE